MSPEAYAPGSTVHRTTARVLPVDPDGRVLLLHGHDPAEPDRTFWFSIGGAVDPGEDLAAAAVRELAEEVGLRVDPARLSAPLGRFDNVFTWGGAQIVQVDTYFAVRIDGHVVDRGGLDAVEQDTIDRAGWWSADELAADGTAAPDVLVEMVRAAAGLEAAP